MMDPDEKQRLMDRAHAATIKAEEEFWASYYDNEKEEKENGNKE